MPVLLSLEHPQFEFEKLDLVEVDTANALFSRDFDAVVHLAAQAGVRHSLEHPRDYIDANVMGFMNVLEGCRNSDVGHLIYASSSSVYGASTELPFSENGNTDHPISLYAATKKANELMAHSYSHLYACQRPACGLRCMVRGDALIWLCIFLLRRSLPASRLSYLIRGNAPLVYVCRRCG